MSRTALILPVRNAGRHLDRLLPALAAQSLRPDEWLVLDSESSDDSKARLPPPAPAWCRCARRTSTTAAPAAWPASCAAPRC